MSICQVQSDMIEYRNYCLVQVEFIIVQQCEVFVLCEQAANINTM